MTRFVLGLALTSALASVPAAAAPTPEIRVRVTPLGKAVAGKPLRVLVGIKNVSRARLLLAGPDTPGLTTHWFRYSFYTTGEGPGQGGAGGVAKGSLHSWDGQVCPRLQDVIGLEPGSEMHWAAEAKLGDDLPAGPAVVTVRVTVAKLRPDLECGSASLVEARASKAVVVEKDAGGR
jgi:hypothetical protein